MARAAEMSVEIWCMADFAVQTLIKVGLLSVSEKQDMSQNIFENVQLSQYFASSQRVTPDNGNWRLFMGVVICQGPFLHI